MIKIFKMILMTLSATLDQIVIEDLYRPLKEILHFMHIFVYMEHF